MADEVSDETVAEDEDDKDEDWSVEDESGRGLSADPLGSLLLTPSPTRVDEGDEDDANEDDNPNSWGGSRERTAPTCDLDPTLEHPAPEVVFEPCSLAPAGSPLPLSVASECTGCPSRLWRPLPEPSATPSPLPMEAMAILDGPLTVGDWEGTTPTGGGGTAREGMEELGLMYSRCMAVSYTHLTLPTMAVV